MRMRYTLTGDRIPWKLSPAPEITMSIFTIRAAENDPEEVKPLLAIAYIFYHRMMLLHSFQIIQLRPLRCTLYRYD